MWHKAAERKLEDEVKRAEEERARANADMGGLGAVSSREGGGGPRVGFDGLGVREPLIDGSVTKLNGSQWNAVYLDSYLSFLVAIADGRNVDVLKVCVWVCRVCVCVCAGYACV